MAEGYKIENSMTKSVWQDFYVKSTFAWDLGKINITKEDFKRDVRYEDNEEGGINLLFRDVVVGCWHENGYHNIDCDLIKTVAAEKGPDKAGGP